MLTINEQEAAFLLNDPYVRQRLALYNKSQAVQRSMVSVKESTALLDRARQFESMLRIGQRG